MIAALSVNYNTSQPLFAGSYNGANFAVTPAFRASLGASVSKRRCDPAYRCVSKLLSSPVLKYVSISIVSEADLREAAWLGAASGISVPFFCLFPGEFACRPVRPSDFQ